MADNVAITAGAGTTVATDDAGGVHFQRVKLVDGTLDGTDAIPGTAANGLDVDVTRLPALVAGSANIGDVDVASIAAGDNNIGNVDIVTLPALVAGSANIGDVDVLTVPAPLSTTGGGTEATALRVTIASDSTGLVSVDDNSSSLTVDAPIGTPVNVQIGNATLAAGVIDETGASAVAALAVGGGTAHDAVDSGNPIKCGSKCETAPSTVTLVADGDRTEQYADADGLQMVKPYCSYGDVLVERVTNTDGASTASTVFGATASTRNCITTIAVHNSAGTAGFIDFRDGTAGTVLFTLPLPAGGGAVISFPVPLRQTTANTAFAFDVSAALSTVYISLIGFKTKA